MVILVDFDNTIVDSSRCVFEIYQEETGDNSKEYNYMHGWNFEGMIPENYTEMAVNLFNKEVFYKNLQPIKNSIEVLKRVSTKHDVVIVTKSEREALPLKSKWISEHLPFINNVIYLEQDDYNKGWIKGDVIIDDKVECLLSGEWEYTILFGDYGWNQTDKYLVRINDWLSLERVLKNIEDYTERIW